MLNPSLSMLLIPAKNPKSPGLLHRFQNITVRPLPSRIPLVVLNADPAWIPYPLRPWFWIPFFVLLVLVAIGLEIALHFSNKNNGELQAFLA